MITVFDHRVRPNADCRSNKEEKSMKQFRGMLFVIVSLFVISGCSSKGELKEQRPLDTRIDHRAVASLSVQPDEKVEKTEAVMKAVQRLQGRLYDRLVSEGVFGRVVQAGEASQYDVRVRLLVATEVSQGARILFGVLAGANELAALVDVFDTASRAPLVSFTAKGKSASHPLSSENEMDDAIREAVGEIILELKS
jgi:hypothetical protein